MSVDALPGVYRGLVTEVRDPVGRGRVQVKVPAVSGEETVWAPVVVQCRPALTPTVGDEVLVAFEGGDLRSPFVLGTLWDSSDPPPS